jgi:hypothetical protein
MNTSVGCETRKERKPTIFFFMKNLKLLNKKTNYLEQQQKQGTTEKDETSEFPFEGTADEPANVYYTLHQKALMERIFPFGKAFGVCVETFAATFVVVAGKCSEFCFVLCAEETHNIKEETNELLFLLYFCSLQLEELVTEASRLKSVFFVVWCLWLESSFLLLAVYTSSIAVNSRAVGVLAHGTLDLIVIHIFEISGELKFKNIKFSV